MDSRNTNERRANPSALHENYSLITLSWTQMTAWIISPITHLSQGPFGSATPGWKTPSNAFSRLLSIPPAHPQVLLAVIPAAWGKQVPHGAAIGAGWIHLLSNRVALCQPTVIWRDIDNGNISTLPPRCLQTPFFHIKPGKGLKPQLATAHTPNLLDGGASPHCLHLGGSAGSLHT